MLSERREMQQNDHLLVVQKIACIILGEASITARGETAAPKVEVALRAQFRNPFSEQLTKAVLYKEILA